MIFTRYINNLHWTPRSFFALAFLCCILFAQAADASTESSVSRNWQQIKGSLPHSKIPDTASQIAETDKWAMPYAVGLAKLVGLGFAIAFLSILVGVVYGIIKLLRACCRALCCSSSDSDEEAGMNDEEEEETSWSRHWIPTLVYAGCWIIVLVGMCIGLQGNPKFSNGVDDMGDAVVLVGNGAIDLGNGLLNGVNSIVSLIPVTITGIENQFAGVDGLADSVVTISVEINATAPQIGNITREIGAIDAGNTSMVSQLYSQLASINNQSVQILASVSSLTDQVANKLQTTYNSTISELNGKVTEIDQTVDGLENTAKGIINQAKEMVSNVINYVNKGKSYDQSRQKGVLALFVFVILITAAIGIGYVLRLKIVFNIVAAFCFVFLFFLWFSGSIHFMLGLVLYDACPVVDVAVQGMLPSGSTAGNVLNGCLFEHRTVLASLNITAYNLSTVFDYKDEFESFADFSNKFNFSQIDSYFDSIHSLYKYNLTAVADNMTVANFGWNETVIYTALDQLNNMTYPDYYDESNYTQCNPNNYSPPKNQTVYEAITTISDLIVLNQTIYNKTELAKTQLLAAQDDINALIANMGVIQAKFDAVEVQVQILETKNISACIGVLNYLQNNITGFFETGNCSFLSTGYVDIKDALCEVMQPAIDCLTVGQFLAGLALIPMLIYAEILGYRYPKAIVVNPFGSSDDDDYESKKKEEKRRREKEDKDKGHGYVQAATDSPSAPRRTGLTATIGATHPMSSDSSPSSSPDFNANRRIIHEHLTNRDNE